MEGLLKELGLVGIEGVELLSLAEGIRGDGREE